MDRHIAQAFIAPAVDHWENEFGRKLKVVSTGRRTGEFRASDIVVTGLMSGDLEGHVCLAVDENTARVGFSARHGRWTESVNDEVLELVGELGRDLFGRASDLLSQAGATCKVRYIGVSISEGKPVGIGGGGGDLIHLESRRPGSGETDNLRLWISLKGDDDPPPEDEPTDATDDVEREPSEPTIEDETATPAAADEGKLDDAAGDLPDVMRARRFELVNEAGQTRAVLSTVPDGSPYLVLADAKGQIRVAIALSKSDAPRIMLLDELGGKIWEKP